MTPLQLVRYHDPVRGPRVGVLHEATVYDVTGYFGAVAAWLRSSAGRAEAAIEELSALVHGGVPSFPAAQLASPSTGDAPYLLPPVDAQDVWAAGVTYERSRAARQEEAQDGGDVYARVYTAQRPELFFKARGPWVVGPYGMVGIRRDATWNVPEPELALVINPALEIVGVTVGNDMSSRDIEGENPLYLPQAKMYTASCALGPGIVLGVVTQNWPSAAIRLAILRNGQMAFEGESHTRQIRRQPRELVEYLGRCLGFPDGAVLLTGAGIVPPEHFTLAPGDEITITIEGIGALTNRVRVVG